MHMGLKELEDLIDLECSAYHHGVALLTLGIEMLRGWEKVGTVRSKAQTTSKTSDILPAICTTARYVPLKDQLHAIESSNCQTYPAELTRPESARESSVGSPQEWRWACKCASHLHSFLASKLAFEKCLVCRAWCWMAKATASNRVQVHGLFHLGFPVTLPPATALDVTYKSRWLLTLGHKHLVCLHMLAWAAAQAEPCQEAAIFFRGKHRNSH
jgi:hypothetical protein